MVSGSSRRTRTGSKRENMPTSTSQHVLSTHAFFLSHTFLHRVPEPLCKGCAYILYQYHHVEDHPAVVCTSWAHLRLRSCHVPARSRESVRLSRPRNSVKHPPHGPRRDTYSGTSTGPVPVTCTCNATRAPPGGDRFMIVGQGATAAVPTGSAECMPQLVLEDLALGSSGFRCAHPAVHARTCPIVA